MHPGVFAAKEPDRPAVIMAAAGTVVTYAELEARSNQVAWLARRSGLRPGDGLAAIAENRPELLDLAWGAQRSGLQFTAVNWHLTAAEAGYVVTDRGARVVVVSSRLAGLAAQLGPMLAPGVRRLMIGDTIPGWDSYQDAVDAQPATPVPDECEGDIMLYSSGTTGWALRTSSVLTGRSWRRVRLGPSSSRAARVGVPRRPGPDRRRGERAGLADRRRCRVPASEANRFAERAGRSGCRFTIG